MKQPETAPPALTILGAGLSGLAVAWETLHLSEESVLLLEAEERPGGMARSLEVEGVKSDLGPHRIYSRIPEMRDWFHQELGGVLRQVNRKSAMVVGGRFFPYPPGPLDMLAAFGPWEMGRFAGSYGVSLLRKMGAGLQGDSFADAMEGAFGQALCEKLVFPYIRKTWKQEPEDLSRRIAETRATMGGMAQQVRRLVSPEEKAGQESTLRRFHYFPGGIEGLTRHLVEGIESRGGQLKCPCRVERLVVNEGRVEAVEWTDELGEKRRQPVEKICSTLPLPELAGMLQSPAGEPWLDKGSRVAFSRLQFVGAVLVFFVVRKSRLTDAHWLYFPESEPEINRAYESKNFDPDMGPEDRCLICVEMTARADGTEWQNPDSHFQNRAKEALEKIGLFRGEEIMAEHSLRLPQAYPLYTKGFEKDLAQALGTLKGLSNFLPLGRQGLFQHNNMDHALYAGFRAARRLQEGPCGIRRWYEADLPEFDTFQIVD